MAEFLIYNKEHWMDALTPKQIKHHCLRHPKFRQKYNARYQRGDIVEVRPDGFYTGANAKGFRRDTFRVVAVLGLSIDAARQYHIPLEKVAVSYTHLTLPTILLV